MHSDDLVSVIIPTYNRQRTITRSIRSVLNQTYENLEIIVVDDGSTDDTASIVAEIDDRRIRFLARSTNGGAGAARNTGIAAAKGTYIAFQDSDDEWLPEKLEQQMEALRVGPPSAVAAYCAKIVYGIDREARHGGRRASVVPDYTETALSGDIHEPLCRRNVISTQTLIVKATAASKVGGFDTRLKTSEEWDYSQRLSTLGEIIFVDVPLVVTYRMDDSISLPSRRNIYSTLIIANKMRHRDIAPRVVASHLAGLGTRLGYYGKPRTGRRLVTYALRANPVSLRYWLRYVASFIPQTARRLSSALKGLDVAPDRRL